MASRALLKVGGRCNGDCRFCHAGGPRPEGPELSTREVCRRMVLAARAGHDGVVLSGGEPTLRRDLVALARFASAEGLSFGVVTNGIVIADVATRGALLEAGLAYVLVSLHGPDREVHNGLSGVASFDEVTAAISALAQEDVELAVSTVVCRPNVTRLAEVARLTARLAGEERRPGWPRHRLSLLEPKGRAAADDELVPDPRVAAEAIAAVIASRSESPAPRLGHDGLPPCLAPVGAEAPDDLRAHGITAMQEAREDRLYPTDPGRRAHGSNCDRCGVRGSCPGLYAGYLPRWESALVPLR